MPEIERTCDRVGIIRDGRLVAVEDIGELRAKALRMIEVRFATPVSASELEVVPGVRDLVVDGDHAGFTAAGPIDPIVKALARHDVVDLVSHEPSLEDLFLTFYGEGRDAPDPAEPTDAR
jgi:ABC-2 type transport system ATP-binding protein